jgi:hypothetical protein
MDPKEATHCNRAITNLRTSSRQKLQGIPTPDNVRSRLLLLCAWLTGYRHGIIQRRWPGNELNKVASLFLSARHAVPAEPPKTARGKDIIRSLNEIIRLENERGAISAMQQQGRQNAGTEASDSGVSDSVSQHEAETPQPAVSQPEVLPLTPAPEARRARTAAKRARTAISELALAMPIPPKRRRKL